MHCLQEEPVHVCFVPDKFVQHLSPKKNSFPVHAVNLCAPAVNLCDLQGNMLLQHLDVLAVLLNQRHQQAG